MRGFLSRLCFGALIPFVFASPLLADSIATYAGIQVLSVGSETVECRFPDAFSPLNAEIGAKIPFGSLLICRDQLATESISLPRFSFGNDQILELFPGSMAIVAAQSVQILRGKLKVIVPAKAVAVTLRIGDVILEMPEGEAFAEKNLGKGVFGLKRGFGWVKAADRKIISFSAGKQIDIGEDGVPGTVRDLDSRWKTLNTPLLSPKITLPTPTDVQDQIASLTELGTETMDVASFSPPLAAEIARHLASESTIASDSFIASAALLASIPEDLEHP